MALEQSFCHSGVVGDCNEDYDDDESYWEGLENDHDQGTSIMITRTVETMSDCIFECFQTSPFVLDSFISLFNEFFESEQFSTSTHHTINTIKSKIITRLLIKTLCLVPYQKAKSQC